MIRAESGLPASSWLAADPISAKVDLVVTVFLLSSILPFLVLELWFYRKVSRRLRG